MNRAKIFGALTLALLAQQWAHASSDGGDRRLIQSRYAAYSRAYKQRNLSIMAAYLTPDYKVIANGKPSSREEVLRAGEEQLKAMHDVKATKKILKLTVSGKQAVALVEVKFSGKTGTRAVGQDHILAFNATARDTWVKTAKGWMQKKSEILESVATMDGKPIKRG